MKFKLLIGAVGLKNRNDMVMEVCILAGKLLLQSGAETYRVEDTMRRIAEAFQIDESHSFITPTGIIFVIDTDEPTKTKLVRVSNRTTDLHEVTLVNTVSREIAEGKLTLRDAYAELKKIEKENLTFPIWLQIIAAAVASGCFLIMFDGKWDDFFPATIAGGAGYTALIYIHKLVPVKFLSEFMASVIIGLVAIALVHVGVGSQLDKIIIGSVMPLVPGVLITNAVRDLMADHLLTGLSKGAEAVLTAVAVGSGVVVVLFIFS